ncbi:MAG: formate/nitrite transporter family protein [Evtepia sp.]
MKRRIPALILSSILAGVCIALGGTIFLRVRDLFPGASIVGALFFTIGLFTVCTRKYALFTGKACYLFDGKAHPNQSVASYGLDLILIWIGNFIGTALVAFLEQNTSLCVGEKGLDVVATALVDTKMAAPLISLFILGFFCNIFIFIAVNGFMTNPHEVGKYLALFLGVAVFILCGTEHSVADMYYWLVSGTFYSDPLASCLRLLVISAGNILGGILIPVLETVREKWESPVL